MGFIVSPYSFITSRPLPSYVILNEVGKKDRGKWQGPRKLVSGGIRIPDNPLLVRQTVLKKNLKQSGLKAQLW